MGLVPAAGRGVRLGQVEPKAFVAVGGTPMLRLAVDGLMSAGMVDEIYVMVPADLVESALALLPSSDSVRVVAGAAERTGSVRAGIAAAGAADFFLVHDAARALTPPSLIARVVAELHRGHPAVVPALPVADTVKTVDSDGVVTGTPDRSSLRAIQTPQGFSADLLRAAYAADIAATDDARLVELLGAQVHTVAGESLAFKITDPLDLYVAEALLARSGQSATTNE